MSALGRLPQLLAGSANPDLVLGNYAQARDDLEQSLRLCREIGDQLQEGWTLRYLGGACLEEGDYPRASAHAEQKLRIFREIGQRGAEGHALVDLGQIRFCLGDYAGACAYCEQALRVRRKTVLLDSRLTLLRSWI